VEENLTFDGSTLGVTGNVNVSGQVSGATGVFTAVTVNGQPTTYGNVNGSYLFVQNNADQSTGQNVAVAFQTTNASNGSLITKTSNTQVTLTAGNTYKLEGIVRRMTSSSTSGAFRWYDVTNATYVGVEGFSEVTNSASAIGSTNVATYYVTPSVNTTYELRQTTANTISVSLNYASYEITQINPTVAMQATATGTLNATVGNVTLSSSYSQSVAASTPGTTIFTLPTLQPGTYLITAQAKVNGGYSAMGIFTGGSQVPNTSVFSWYQPSGTVNNGLQGTWVLTLTTPTVYTINAWGGGTVSAGSDGAAVANYIQINPTFSLTAINGLTTTGDVNVGGNLTATGGIRKSSRILTTTTTLTVADAGSFIQFNGGPYTVTLPNPTLAANSGIGYRFWQNTSNNITLSTPGGAFYGPSGSVTSTVVLVQATTQYWDVWSDGFNWAVFGIKMA
jgi:hypothetical protein